MGVLGAVEHIFNETAIHARTQASNRLAKANRASHGPRVRAKARVKRTRENCRNRADNFTLEPNEEESVDKKTTHGYQGVGLTFSLARKHGGRPTFGRPPLACHSTRSFGQYSNRLTQGRGPIPNSST